MSCDIQYTCATMAFIIFINLEFWLLSTFQYCIFWQILGCLLFDRSFWLRKFHVFEQQRDIFSFCSTYCLSSSFGTEIIKIEDYYNNNKYKTLHNDYSTLT